MRDHYIFHIRPYGFTLDMSGSIRHETSWYTECGTPVSNRMGSIFSECIRKCKKTTCSRSGRLEASTRICFYPYSVQSLCNQIAIFSSVPFRVQISRMGRRGIFPLQLSTDNGSRRGQRTERRSPLYTRSRTWIETEALRRFLDDRIDRCVR